MLLGGIVWIQYSIYLICNVVAKTPENGSASHCWKMGVLQVAQWPWTTGIFWTCEAIRFFLLHVNQVWWVWVRFEVTSLLNFRCLCRTEVVGSSLQRLAYLWSFTAVAGTTLQERCVSFVRFPWLPFLDVCRIRSGEARVWHHGVSNCRTLWT